jgi:hypothetical protein
MSERILIAGEPTDVPPEVVSAGRDAVQKWHVDTLTKKAVPFVVFDGDPVELPAAIVGKTKKEIEAWKADEAERRVDPIAYAEKKAAEAAKQQPASTSPTANTAAAPTTNPSKE